jgi:phage shock protein E
MNRYWIVLIGFLCLAGSSPAAEENSRSQSGAHAATKIKGVGVEEFDKLRADKANVVLDVRTPKEFQAGHIPGALNIDLHSPDFDKRIGELDKNKTYLVHCASGGRSAVACKKLGSLGFKELFDLRPGFNGWRGAGKPVEK